MTRPKSWFMAMAQMARLLVLSFAIMALIEGQKCHLLIFSSIKKIPSPIPIECVYSIYCNMQKTMQNVIGVKLPLKSKSKQRP